MKKILTVLSVSVVLAYGSPAVASGSGCTAQELQAKGVEVAAAMQSIAASDPALMQEIARDLQNLQTKATSVSGGDYAEICEAYDDILAKIK
jgi:hypothetical protein